MIIRESSTGDAPVRAYRSKFHDDFLVLLFDKRYYVVYFQSHYFLREFVGRWLRHFLRWRSR